MKQQLTLKIGLSDQATFANFYSGDNQTTINYLQQTLATKNHNENFIYLYGPTGAGLSHLLQACCHHINSQQQTAIYLPLKQPLSTAILENIEHSDLICIDDLQLIATDKNWQEALFHFYNRWKNTQARLIISANAPVQQLNLSLADLSSRLTTAIIFAIKPLSDNEKIAALQLRAKNRGLELPTEAADYLLHRLPRDMPTLLHTLEQLDQASLTWQRKLTIPFIKTVL